MKNIFSVLLGGIIVVLFIFSSCEQVVYPPLELPDAGDTVSYSLAIQPIWDNKCVDCHSEETRKTKPYLSAEVSYDELINGDYVDTADVESSKLIKKLNTGAHKSRATEMEKQLISIWITQGAKNN